MRLFLLLLFIFSKVWLCDQVASGPVLNLHSNVNEITSAINEGGPAAKSSEHVLRWRCDGR